jgi:hypothetical protein
MRSCDFVVHRYCGDAKVIAMDYPRQRAILRKPKRKPATPVQGYQLKVILEDTKPVIWRRIVVRGDMKLGLLHAVLQVAMGWTNSHLHMFLVGACRFTDPTLVDNSAWEEGEDKDERNVVLSQVVASGITVFGYEYDFGDSWTHRVAVEKALPPDLTPKVCAECVDGARACPPEDCGGTWGYDDLLKVVKNPRDEEHKSMMEWLGGQFDPDAFDVEETNRYLRMLKWPKTSVSCLGKVIQARLAQRGSL